MLLHHTEGQDPAETERLLAKLVEDNQVSRGLLLPEGDSDTGAVCRTLLGFVPSWLEAMTGTGARMRALMRDDFLEPHRRTDVIATLLSSLDVRGRLEGRNAVHGALYLWAKTALPHYILSNLGDRMEMAHSVEGRVPFMDHNVAEYLHQVPVSMKIRGMTENDVPFLDQKKLVAALDGLRDPDADFGHQVITDQVLTLALSFVFMHEGLGISA
jgi:asparagine synthase (glutamine-hydrolysing)